MFLAIHQLWRATKWGRAPVAGRRAVLARAAGIVLTFHCVCLAWCLFRVPRLSDALVCMRKLVVFDPARLFAGGSGDVSLWLLLSVYGYGVLMVSVVSRRRADRPDRPVGSMVAGIRWGAVCGLLILSVLLAPGGERPPFIYFQF
jgi:hypothetical protein